MFLIVSRPPKRDEPERCYLHAHIKDDNRCFWATIDTRYGKECVHLNIHATYAEAFTGENVNKYVEIIKKDYGDQLLELIAVPCSHMNGALSLEQMRLLRLI